MSDRKFELSRRKALLGLGTVGIASAGAGLGTSAYFSDEESFGDNMLTAGTLNLLVHYYADADQGMAGHFDVSGTNDGDDPAAEFSLGDVKPGDSGTADFCFEIEDNPAYLWACGELTDSSENGYTEPEPETEEEGDINDPGDPDGDGELEDSIMVDMMYCTYDDNEPDSDGPTSTGQTIVSGTLREVLDQLHGGVPLDGTGDGEAEAGSQAAYDGTNNDTGNSDVTNPCVCFDWELPMEVGNEIQGDSLEFDLQFYAEQARHNDGTHNPCLVGETGDGWAKDRRDFSPSLNARGRFGQNNPDTGATELDIRDANDDIQVEDNHGWESGVSQSFEVSYDGSEVTLDVGGKSISTTDVAPSDDDAAITVGAGDGEVTVENVAVNGQTPSDASSVSANGDTQHLFIAGGGLAAGGSITGDVTFTWSGSPAQEGLKFRVDI